MIVSLTKPSQIKLATRRKLVHIRELDGLRGIAALMVFFHHLCYVSIDPAHWGFLIRLLYHVSSMGYAGVDVFFVLSGFLITSLLIEDRGAPAYYHNFYWKRALRILPLYAVCLLGVFLFVPGSGGYVVLSAFFVANFAQLFHISSSGPFWTLAIEEQFYLLWPTLVRRRTIAQLSNWALGIAIVCSLLRLVDAFFGHFNFYFTFLHCDGLAMGAFLACRFETRDEVSARRITNELVGFFIASVPLIALAIPWNTSSIHNGMAYSSASMHTGISLLCAAIVGYLIMHANDRRLSFLRSGFLPFMGLISYAFYMTHFYVMTAYTHLAGPLRDGDVLAYTIRLLLVAAITIALCLVSRYAIELPAISLRKYVLKRE